MLPLGVISGFVATLGMDLVMGRLPEGGTAPKVAAGVLTGKHPDDSSERLSEFVHYFAGAGSGALYAYLYLGVGYFSALSASAEVAFTAAVLYLGMVGFFVAVPLRACSVEKGRRSEVARDWGVSALVYVSVVSPVFAALSYVAG
jgi:hypothetical protein